MAAGYSGTPLPKKLGIKEAHRVGVANPPPTLDAILRPLPEHVAVQPLGRGNDFDVILFFASDSVGLARGLSPAISKMAPDTALWLCWPKKSSSLATELDENEVRGAGLQAGLVDVKICAVDEDWSGLKFVYRLKDRPGLAKKRTNTSARKK